MASERESKIGDTECRIRDNEKEVGLDSIRDKSIQVIEEEEASGGSRAGGEEPELCPDPIIVRIPLRIGTSGAGASISGKEPYALT